MRFKLVSFCGFWEQIYNIGSCGIAVLFFFLYVLIQRETNKENLGRKRRMKWIMNRKKQSYSRCFTTERERQKSFLGS